MTGQAVLQMAQIASPDQENLERDRERRANLGKCADHQLLPCRGCLQ